MEAGMVFVCAFLRTLYWVWKIPAAPVSEPGLCHSPFNRPAISLDPLSLLFYHIHPCFHIKNSSLHLSFSYLAFSVKNCLIASLASGFEGLH